MNEILLDKTIALANKIKEDEIYQELKELAKIINEKYQLEIKEFNEAKDKLADLNKYSLDYEEKKNLMLEKKKILFGFPEVIKYKKLEIKFNQMLKEISDDIKELA